jgi:Transposase
VLGVGVDWAESFHDVALGRPDDGVVEQFRIGHDPAGVARLARCLELEPDPAEVRVVLEARHGLLVEALTDAVFTVLPVNPDLVARRRGPAKKKDDAEDARICCLLALDSYLDLRKLIPGHQGWLLSPSHRDCLPQPSRRVLATSLRQARAARNPAQRAVELGYHPAVRPA